jgi:DNA polymerase III subunit epsilon
MTITPAHLPDELLNLGDFAFIDVETTGTKPLTDRLTEIAIIRFSAGKSPVRWQSLLNPGIAIPAEIQALTGITNAMVRDAPTFFSLRETVRDLLLNAFFVAHNARFDYGFIKNEFRRAGDAFTRDVLCTVRLSRKLYPGDDGHGLDALVHRHSLGGFDRHRAMGDAAATAAFVAHAVNEHGAAAVSSTVKSLLKMPSLPAHLPADAISVIPDTSGVYLFFGINELPIYIGKAKHLRERIRAHFSADHMTPNDIRLSQELRRIEWRPTAGEFSALLLEAQLVKEMMPLHNVALRRREKAGFLLLSADAVAPSWIAAAELTHVDAASPGALYFGPFGDKTSAKKWLMHVAKDYQLCDHALGFSRPRGDNDPCFARQVGRCYGVCVGAESASAHRERLRGALSELAMPPWPFEGIATFIEKDVANDHTDIMQFDQWCAMAGGQRLPFDPDVFKLLRRTLTRKPGQFTGHRRI